MTAEYRRAYPPVTSDTHCTVGDGNWPQSYTWPVERCNSMRVGEAR